MTLRPGNRARNIWTLERLMLAPGMSVLELGCGPGWALSRAAKLAPGGIIVGLDHSPLMRQIADRRLKGRGRILLGSLEDWPDLGWAGFDRIYAINSVQFVRDKMALCQRVRTALRPGGLFAAVYEPRNPGATDDDATVFASELECACRAAGLTLLNTQTRRLGRLNTVSVLAMVADS
jgi:cyclopropane fatty-acyl-phospholipid synthase-like methyltransferase